MESSNVHKYVEQTQAALGLFNVPNVKAWDDFYKSYSNYEEDVISFDINDENYASIKYLDLSDENLEHLPVSISKFKNLEILDLSGNPLRKVTSISRLTNLKVLILDFCDLQQDDILEKLPESLFIISLSYLGFRHFLLTKKKYNNLLLLNLSDNRLTHVDWLDGAFSNLIHLDLNNNHFKEIPLAAVFLPSLKRLMLANNNIINFPEIKKQTSTIEELLLLGNKLKIIPESIRAFIKLRSLHLKQNPIEDIHPSICFLPLQHICATTVVAKAALQLFKVKSVRDLDLTACRLQEIPDYVSELTELIELTLNKNSISEVPSALGSCTQLQTLRINDNVLTAVHDKLGSLPVLSHVDFGNNLLRDVPTALFSLGKLDNLLLHNNFIDEIPSDIQKLSSLTCLSLSSNKIESLPTEIGSLENLSILMLEGNKLEYLPAEIGALINLEDLALDGNNLLAYPYELADLQRLNKIYTFRNDNPLTDMPEAKGLGLVQLFEFLNQKRGRAKYAIEWDVPSQLQTAFQQYMNFFTDYVLRLTGHPVTLEVNKIDNGLKIVTQTTAELSIELIDEYLTQFIGYFIKDNTDDLDSILKQQKASREQIFEVRQLVRDMEFENRNLRSKIQGHIEKIIFLTESIQEKKDMIEQLNIHLRFFTQNNSSLLSLQPSTNNTGNINVNVTVLPNPVQQNVIGTTVVSDESFLADLIDKAARMLERKRVEKLEDLHNSDFAHFLRDKYYYITDQTQSGIANSNLGELDIMVRKNNGTPISIIEAFKLASCGEKNAEISSHIDKLLHNYDTAGLQTNYIIVYALSKKFDTLWTNYVSYVQDINNKPGFTGTHRLISFVETSTASKFTDVKVGLAIHKRNNSNVRVYHIFINMYL